ncbi:serine/threonine-protein kinase [Runella sp.]|uniref:serine/threonine-protein kinase n=1 Tax=Runella sp. TaxID=1960881 RepID=UPI002639F825|nr:serine/threonine-protein kinase [Runella sp.]
MPTISFNQYFPGYEILGELGRANARVLKARHLPTGDLVAIKHFSFNTDAETLRRFQQESTIMTTIQHPNVVKVREVHFDAELPYIVMELVEGGDVRSLLKKSDFLDVPTVIRLGLQMADALKAIHDKEVVHRDIKPDNIMYRELQSGELHFLLTDFGIAKLRNVESMTITGQAPMTPEYASPEQFNDLENATEATDFYSLGIVLYECLTGNVPFPLGSKGIGALSRRVEEEAPPPIAINGFFPASLQKIVNSLLQKKPNERLTNSTTLKRGLKKADWEWDEGENGAEEIPPLPNNKTKMPPPIDPVKPIDNAQKKNRVTEKEEKPIDKIPPKQEEKRIEKEKRKQEVEPQKKSGSNGLGWAIGFVIIALIAAVVYLKFYESSPQQTFYPTDTSQTTNDADYVADSSIDSGEHTSSEVTLIDPRKLVEIGISDYNKQAYEGAFGAFYNAAEQGNATGQSWTGYLYDKGLGITEDKKEAEAWYLKAAEQGNALAQNNLGVLYESGSGVEQNYTQALLWYRKSADQENDWGQYNLGSMYANGYGIRKDMSQALTLYRLAAEQGNTNAITALKNLGYSTAEFAIPPQADSTATVIRRQ